jgi:CHAT domain-containing protein
LPIHAAGDYSRASGNRCSDYIVSSYTPTVSALVRAQKQSGERTFQHQDINLLLVSEPKAHQPGLPVLPGAVEELANVQEIVSALDKPIPTPQRMNSATVSDLAVGLATANFVHLACHGIQNTMDALDSGFCLSDGELTVTKLMDLKLDHAFFAFLSACETAKGDEQQPDQVVHLAAAMLFSGFKSVVATMW